MPELHLDIVAPRPFQREGRTRRMLPFLAPVPFVYGWAILSLREHPLALVAGLSLTVVLIALAWLAPWDQLPRWAEGAIALGGVVSVGFLNMAGAPDRAIFAPLVLVPVFWIALYGSRIELLLSIPIVAGAFVLPAAFIGGEIDLLDVGRRASLWMVVAATCGFTTQELVRRLWDLHARTRAIIDSSHEAFIGMDSDGTIMEWNPAAERMFGWGRSEVMGRPVADVVIPMDARGRHLAGLERYLRTGEGSVVGRRLELDGLHREGHEFPIEITISAVPGGVGGPTFHAFLHDITDRRHDDDRRSQYAEQLELLNRELQVADELKSRFLAMASHELRTPLTAISGFSATMISMWHELPDDQKLHFVTIIDVQAERLSRLVTDLLTLSRIEGGRLEPRPVAVNVAMAIRHTLTGLSSEQRITVGCPEDLAVLADQDHVQQILVNYVSNARKYGGEPIEIEAAVVDGRWVRIEVRDSGDGVPDEFVPHLFDRFTQARPQVVEAVAVTNGEAEGTGLGLSIVKGLAEAQGGEVWFEPNVPTGACFGVRLPLAPAPGGRT